MGTVVRVSENVSPQPRQRFVLELDAVDVEVLIRAIRAADVMRSYVRSFNRSHDCEEDAALRERREHLLLHQLESVSVVN